MYEGLMVSVSGVRGRVGEALTPEIVAKFASGFGAWALAGGRSKLVVVGRDSRVSGPMFHRIVVGSLQSVGATVVDIGMSTTPTTQLAVEHHHAAGGIMISASHNPIEWNALKMIGPTGLFLDAVEGTAMRAMMEAGVPRAKWQVLGDVLPDHDAVGRHIDAVLALPFISVDKIRARKFRIALDSCRGAGAIIVPELLDRLGCTVTAINLEPDGRFPRPPEPIPENLTELEGLVRDSRSDIGIAVDPDVDRLALVAENGKAIGEDYTLALAAKLVLRHRIGPVVINLSTSRVVDDVAIAAGAPVIRAPVVEV
jgi:phosphomannomutase